MLCLKTIPRRVLIYSFAFLLAFCSISFSLVSSASAVSDISYSVDSSNYTSDFLFCGGSSGVSCSDYSFIRFTVSFSSSNYYFQLQNQNTSMRFQIYPYISQYIYALSDTSTLNYYGNSGTISTFFTNNPNAVISFTLTDSISSPCPPCESCDAPYTTVLNNILSAIFLIPATALVIYFFYCIYRLIIKNTGGAK